MHAQNLLESDSTNPYIQIMFNINSKNVVNNNIHPQNKKNTTTQLKKQTNYDKANNTQKKINPDNKAKFSKSVMTKANTTLLNITKQDHILEDSNLPRQKKKTTQKSNLTGSESHRSSKQTVHKKNTSEGFSKLHPSQEAQLSERKPNTKSKPKLKSVTPNNYHSNNQKDTRQKIIELMIRDYQRGNITADNLKEAISSLIEREAEGKRLGWKSHNKSEKPRSRIATSYKNSLAASLHMTPKHKPSKSKSQKFHYPSHQPQTIFNRKECGEEPEIMQRTIHNKEFMSKIVIKGINSSLFLSNQWTDKGSPIKESQRIDEVCVNVINTSDSVKDLRKQMRKAMVSNRQEKEKEISGELGGFQKGSQQQRQKDTRNILTNFLDELKGLSSRNEFIPSGQALRRQKSVSSSQNSLKYLTRLKEEANYHESSEENQQQHGHRNSIDDQYVRESQNIDADSSEYSKIEDLQKQYALLLRDKQSESRNQGSLPNESIEKYKNDQSVTNIRNRLAQLQLETVSPKIKSYVSSQLQNKLQNSGPLSEAKLQVTQKRVKSITQTQIKKLNQIMDVIKDQLSKKQSSSTNDTKDSEVLEKIVSLLESERSKVQQELKLYNQIDQTNFEQNKNKKSESESLSSRKNKNEEKNDKIEQNQIINSFQKKIKRLNLLENTPLQNTYQEDHRLKVYFESSEIKSHSSRKSLNSSNNSSSAHHLQKVKISELNLDEIQLGLRKRLNDLEDQKEHEYSIITQKFINDKITPKQYQQQKQIIQKWFQIESKQLRRTKRSLLEGYKRAKEVIDKNQLYETKLSKEKSTKMIKCISQKYLGFSKVSENNVFNENGAETLENNIQVPKHLKKTKQQQIVEKGAKIQIPVKKNYETIEELQQELLIRNITPIQKFLTIEKEEKQQEILSPLSIQESKISSEGVSNNTSSNSNEVPEILVTLQECSISEEGQTQKQEEIIKNKGKKDASRKQSDHQIYEYEEVKSKRPESAKLHSQIVQYLQKYEDSGSSDQKPSGKHDFPPKDSSLLSIENDQNQSSSNSQTEYLQEYGDESGQADNQESSNENYEGYNDTEEGQNDAVDSAIQRILKSSSETHNQESLNSSQGLELEEPSHIIVNKNPASLNSDELFSPKKPTIHEHEQFSQELLKYDSTSHQQHQKVSLEFSQLNKSCNENLLKFKYLTQEDKDDIFEFMFLDLCLELFLEQTKNNKIMKGIEKFLIWQRKKKKIPKGFKTGLEACKQYISHIQEFLFGNHMKTLKRLQSPMGPSAKEMLKFMRDYDDIESSESQVQAISLVLPIQIYEKFESEPTNKLQVERYYDDDEKQESRLKFLKSLKHFHHKAMFDSLNQMLDLERCYGIWGKPFPWKKALDVDRKFDEPQIKKKVKHAAEKLIQNCSYFCGVLVDKEESVFGKNNVSEEYLHHIREDRMSKMLSNDMIDNEDRWIFYDDEETQVLVSLSKSITTDLISQMLQEVKIISWK